LVTLGLALTLVPCQVPGPTLPNSSEAREAMMHMEGSSMKMRGDSVKSDSMKGKRDAMKGTP
jgi:hypothetical protein